MRYMLWMLQHSPDCLEAETTQLKSNERETQVLSNVASFSRVFLPQRDVDQIYRIHAGGAPRARREAGPLLTASLQIGAARRNR